MPRRAETMNTILFAVLGIIFLPPLLMEIYVLWAFALDVVRGR
jgi:hypothetical protein